MSTETVPVEKELEQEAIQENAPVEEVIEEVAPPPIEEVEKETLVPLSALQKERKKRQEAEQENKEYRQLNLKKLREEYPEEPDYSKDEPPTRAEVEKQLADREMQIMRSIEESNWISQNPEKAQIVNEKLEEFLKQRPNLTAAINQKVNRYSEAWELMEGLTPKQKAALKPAPVKKEAPGSPTGVPKSAGINQAVDVMNMSDTEFATWRASKRKRR